MESEVTVKLVCSTCSEDVEPYCFGCGREIRSQGNLIDCENGNHYCPDCADRVYIVVKHMQETVAGRHRAYTEVVGYYNERKDADNYVESKAPDIRGWDGEAYPQYTICVATCLDKNV